MNKQAIIETIKSVARALYFGLLGVVMLILTVISTDPDIAKSTITLPVYDITLSIGTIIVAVTASIAKIIDRYIHKSKDIPMNGIAPTFLQK